VDTRNRTALEALNSSVTPSTFELDFRIDKTVIIMDKLSANIFIQVVNLLNTQNIEDVFSNTGSATTNGFLTIPNLGGNQLVQQYGQQFVNTYQAINEQYAGLYGTPRQIRLGIRLEY
jgi:aminoglycoside/choline kinase family phosphotransferase